jgi:hypothetical protein
LLREILENGAEEPKYRRLAAVALWRLNTTEAREVLLAALSTEEDPAVLGGVVKALGRVGDERALAALEALQPRAEGFLAEQVAFAASLLAHRLGLPGNDLPRPERSERVPRSPRGRIELGAPSAEEAESFARTLQADPYGVEIAPGAQFQVRCSAGLWMLALTQPFAAADSLAALRERKTVAGLLASRNDEDGRYSVAYLLFSTPSAKGEGVDLLITRSTGEPAWAGTLESGPDGVLRFAIHTVGRIGIVAIELAGTWSGEGRIRLSRAVSATRVIEKRTPLPMEPPVAEAAF